MAKRVLALIGSRAGARSNTLALTLALFKALSSDIETEILMADEWRISPCQGCRQCFRRGACARDALDGMGELRAKLLRADAVILASPVYAAQVSGDMKTLLDRLSFNLHTMPLIGVPAVALATASCNHLDDVVGYLGDMLETLGASVAGRIGMATDAGGARLGDPEAEREAVGEAARVLDEALGGRLRAPSARTESLFRYVGGRYKNARELAAIMPDVFGEALVWEKQGYFACASAREAARLRGCDII